MFKKAVVFLLLASFIFSLMPGQFFVFAKIDCAKYKNTCPDESLISTIKKSCGTGVLNSVYSACEKEQKTAQQRMSELSSQKADIEKKEGSAKWYLSNINYDIKNINAEVINAEASLDEIEKEIAKIDKIIVVQRKVLSETLRQVYEYDSSSYVEILLGNGNLSDFSDKIAEVEKIERQITSSVGEIMEIRQSLEKKRNEQTNYKKIQELSRQSLAVKRDQQGYFLSQLKSAKTPIEQEMARLNAEIRELKSSMSNIQSYLGNWLMGQRPTWSQIFLAVQNASSSTGTRKALLLAILETESRYGTGLGTAGKYKEYCDGGWDGKTHLDALLRICKKYGYDPAKVPMSVACALGPAQFVPLTWVGYMGYTNPWNLYDAVRGMAVYLKANGATSNREKNAVYRYNHSGSYVNTVMSRAKVWQSMIDVCGLDLDCPKMREKLENSGIPLE